MHTGAVGDSPSTNSNDPTTLSMKCSVGWVLIEDDVMMTAVSPEYSRCGTTRRSYIATGVESGPTAAAPGANNTIARRVAVVEIRISVETFVLLLHELAPP